MLLKECKIAGKTLQIETDRMAKQANGSVLVQLGETVILATAVASKKPLENADFFPLSVEYREKAYAAGKIPGGFFKREGKPSEKEVLSARLIDRPIRPLFPDYYRNEVQVVITVLSSDRENDADILGIIGASAALSVSDIPFDGPVAAVRVGRIQNEWVINPTFTELEDSDMNIVMAASKNAIAMVEGEALEISESDMLKALEVGHEAIKCIITLQETLVASVGKTKQEVQAAATDTKFDAAVNDLVKDKLAGIFSISGKKERRAALDALHEEVQAALSERFPESELEINERMYDQEKKFVRELIVNKKQRIDGRGHDDIRHIACEIGVLPRTHGSALFSRGETQSLTVTTLGTKADEQKIEGLDGSSWKSYMLHYNFPPFSVGEVKPFRGPGRREIGHGNLAERALKPVVPAEAVFPYTIRIVSDILESNGSSSMATVCAGSLSLMDAGVPVKSAVAGIAMGLVMENDEVAVITDILGDEDHLGDMDFKVAGTEKGITAFQMDIKITGISSEIMANALEKARVARLKILEIMNQTISEPREYMSPYAPRIFQMKIDVDDIGMVIGPGGRMIREIVEKSGAEVNIADDGTVQIAAEDEQACEMARSLISALVQKPEPGKIYKGKVKKITNFGAFVEILPGKEGLLHVSNIAMQRVNRVEDHLRIGDEIEVMLLSITPDGKMDLSRKALLKKQKEEDPK
jgi:polyribonucleotide nucleotidyltransferase